jgi:predicted ATPase
VTEAIADRGRVLVVLDNFEQVIQHAPATVGRWLHARDASFMVTSRERLHLSGEVVQLVEPLPLDGSAIDLFVARARAVRHDFAPDAAQRSVIADVVKLLDGLPLAIELAAARIAVLSPSQLLVRLRDRFKVLAGRRGVTRQSTLRAAIDWSWDLLSAWEQAALEQCSVFDGGFTLAAAETVIDLPAWPEAPPVIDAMQAPVDKSLLRRWMPDAAPARHDIEEPYFGMYISIHEYAVERCRARGDDYADAVQDRHGRYFAAFGTDEALEALFTHGGMQRLHALQRELDNLLSACRRGIARADGEVAAPLPRGVEVLALQGPLGRGGSGTRSPRYPGSISALRNRHGLRWPKRWCVSAPRRARTEAERPRARARIGDRKLRRAFWVGSAHLPVVRPIDEAHSYYTLALETQPRSAIGCLKGACMATSQSRRMSEVAPLRP